MKKSEIQKFRWNPVSLEEPTVPEDLEHLTDLARGAEVIRYSVLRLEYWISPSGSLREWLRWNLAVGITMGIPALIIVPVGTYLLTQFVTWSALLVQIMENLLILPILAMVLVALLTGLVLFVKTLKR
jgi:hypothetical protein